MSWTVLFEKTLEGNAHNKKQAKQEILAKSGDPAPTTPDTPKAEMFPSNEGEAPVTTTKKVVKKRAAGGDVAGPVEQTDKDHANAHNTGAMGSHGKKTSSYVSEGAEVKKAKKAGIALSLAGAMNPSGNVHEGMSKSDSPSEKKPLEPETSVKGPVTFDKKTIKK